MSEKLINALLAVMVACAVVVTGLVVRREFAETHPASPTERRVRDWEKYQKGDLVVGSPTAPTRVVVFSDYQCPFCARLNKQLSTLRTSQAIAVTYRHFPLEQKHPYALQAALAAECANAQGRFEAFHNALFESADSIGITPWKDFARAAGVSNVASFDRCVRDSAFIGRVRADIAAGESLEIDGTPALLIGDLLVSGDPNDEHLSSLLKVKQ
jgi:protein-disulfide isomerase